MFPPDTRILIVDDYATQRDYLKTELRRMGFQNVIKTAPSGKEAWAILEGSVQLGQPIQLVISDWEMPEMTGLELLRAVRADERMKSLPFVLLTAVTQQPMIVEAVRAGVSNYISKPFSPNILQDKLIKVWAALQAKRSSEVAPLK
jgi:two-component system chemotaxis response regulator CheY